MSICYRANRPSGLGKKRFAYQDEFSLVRVKEFRFKPGIGSELELQHFIHLNTVKPNKR